MLLLIKYCKPTYSLLRKKSVRYVINNFFKFCSIEMLLHNFEIHIFKSVSLYACSYDSLTETIVLYFSLNSYFGGNWSRVHIVYTYKYPETNSHTIKAFLCTEQRERPNQWNECDNGISLLSLSEDMLIRKVDECGHEQDVGVTQRYTDTIAHRSDSNLCRKSSQSYSKTRLSSRRWIIS